MKAAIYCRVSTNEQSADSQLVVVRDYCVARKFTIHKVYADNGVSGATDSRPGLNQLMADARKRQFGCVVVYRFDRFARSSRHLILALEEFGSLGIDFISYQENIDTSSPLGKAIFTIVGAMSELERNIIVQRVKSGLEAAKRRGTHLGRPTIMYDPYAVLTLRTQGLSLRTIAKQVGISTTTVFRVLQNPPLVPVVNV